MTTEQPTPEQQRNREMAAHVVQLADRLNHNLERAIPLLELAVPILHGLNQRLGGAVKAAKAHPDGPAWSTVRKDLGDLGRGLSDFMSYFR